MKKGIIKKIQTKMKGATVGKWVNVKPHVPSFEEFQKRSAEAERISKIKPPKRIE